MTTRTLPNWLLTAEEVADVLGCGRTTAVKYIALGIIPSVLIENLRRVRLWDFEDYLRSLKPDREPDIGEQAA